jgi:ribosome biogenesis GTPase A
MTKTKRMLLSQLALVDVVVELLDARIPYSSRNPDIAVMAENKKRIIVFTKADIAEPEATRLWERFYNEQGYSTLVLDARKKNEAVKVIDLALEAMREKSERQKKRGRTGMSVRALVAGIPNVGKSTFINALAGRAGAATGDKPGVTRGRQWINVRPNFDILDTPGVLWPKFDDQHVALKLAVTGAVSDDILDRITLCEGLLGMLMEINLPCIESRYKITPEINEMPRTLLERIGDARGFKMKGGIIDLERAAVIVLDEFRGGKLGRITLEMPGTGSVPSGSATIPQS